MSIRNQLLQDILSAIGGGGSVLWGSITGTIADQTDLAEVAKTNDYDDLTNKPDLSDNLTGGWLVYADSATAGTPIAHTGGVNTILTNDELGAQTSKVFAPNGVTDVWNATTGVFDFSELSNGDMIDIRMNVQVDTSSPNQELEIDLMLGQGGFSYLVPFSHETYRDIGNYPVGSFEGIFLLDDNTRLNSGQFIFSSTDDADIVVLGWYCKILMRA